MTVTSEEMVMSIVVTVVSAIILIVKATKERAPFGDYTRGGEYIRNMLEDPSNEAEFKCLFRMSKHCFLSLCDEIAPYMPPKNRLSVEESLAIYMTTVRLSSLRQTKFIFKHSLESICARI